MASRTIVACDLCAKEPAGTTSVTLGSTSYELDLCATHRKAMDVALKPYLAAARSSAGTARSTVKKATRPRGTKKTTRRPRGDSRVADIRTWGQANGFEVAAKGRLRPDVVAAYDAAHKPARAKKAAAA